MANEEKDSLSTLNEIDSTIFEQSLDDRFSAVLDSLFPQGLPPSPGLKDSPGGKKAIISAMAQKHVGVDPVELKGIGDLPEDKLGELASRYKASVESLSEIEAEGYDESEGFNRLNQLGNLLFTKDTDYWLKNTETTKGQGEWVTMGNAPTAGETLMMYESARYGAPMTDSAILAKQIESNPISVIEQYARLSNLSGSSQGLRFVDAYKELEKIISEDPSVFTQYNPLLNALHFWGSDRLDIPGMAPESGEMPWPFPSKPSGIGSLMAGEGLDSAVMWRNLEDYIKKNPGEKGEVARNYKESLIDALPFIQSVKDEYALNIHEYQTLANMYKTGADKDEFLGAGSEDLRDWQSAKATAYQDYKLALDQGIIDAAGNLLPIK